MTITNASLTTRWRALYTVGLLLGLWTAGFGGGGWLGLATGAMPSTFAIPGVVLLFLVLGRIVWVWRRPQVLTWPTMDGLRRLAKVSLIASIVGIAGFLVLIGSGFFIRTLATDVRGAAGLVIGIFLLPFIALASLGLVVFEWARGWSARTIVPASDRALLTSAAIAGALLAIVPAVSSALFPIHSLTRSQYSGILPWIVFALGLGVLIVRGLRGNQFPASATYSTTLAAYVVGAAVLTVLNVLDYRGGFGVTLLVQGKGLLVNGAGFALVLAVVPVGALAILDRLGPDRSGSWVMRALLAVPLVLTVAWLGVSAGTTALRPRQAREFVLSDEQLSGQAKHLQKRCSEAGTHVLSTRSDVTELEIRFPDEPLRKTPAARLRIHPDATRPHHWFPMQGRKPAYERVVFVENGKRTGYGLDAAQSHGYGYVGAEDTYPRYVLTWKSLQTPDEEVDGVVGNEMTIIDTQNNSVLARRVLFFRRTNEHFGVFQEACGTLGQKYIPDAYAYDWATTILIPKSTFANK